MSNRFRGVARQLKHKSNNRIDDKIANLGLFVGEVTTTGINVQGCKHEIQEYMILENTLHDKEYIFETETNEDSSTSHKHKIKTPEYLKPLQEGDIVLMCIADAEYVVIGRLVSNIGE